MRLHNCEPKRIFLKTPAERGLVPARVRALTTKILKRRTLTMTSKSLILAGVLAFSTLSIASAKTYELTLAAPTKAGNVQLKPGQYRLKVDGNNATFTFVDTDKSVTTPVKVETTDKKFDNTRVDANKENGTDVLKDIELGGSKLKIEF